MSEETKKTAQELEGESYKWVSQAILLTYFQNNSSPQMRA